MVGGSSLDFHRGQYEPTMRWSYWPDGDDAEKVSCKRGNAVDVLAGWTPAIVQCFGNFWPCRANRGPALTLPRIIFPAYHQDQDIQGTSSRRTPRPCTKFSLRAPVCGTDLNLVSAATLENLTEPCPRLGLGVQRWHSSVRGSSSRAL